jgi:hypothetical protein
MGYLERNNDGVGDLPRPEDVELGSFQDPSPRRSAREHESENLLPYTTNFNATNRSQNVLKVFGEALVVLSRLL